MIHKEALWLLILLLRRIPTHETQKGQHTLVLLQYENGALSANIFGVASFQGWNLALPEKLFYQETVA